VVPLKPLGLAAATLLCLAILPSPAAAFDIVCTATTGCVVPYVDTCGGERREYVPVPEVACERINCTGAGAWKVTGKTVAGDHNNEKFWAECEGRTVAECTIPSGPGACDSGFMDSGRGKGGCWMTGAAPDESGECIDPANPCIVIVALPSSERAAISPGFGLVRDRCSSDGSFNV